MIKKSEKVIITFNSTTDAMAFESFCKKSGLEGRLIPVPRAISASCGMCWSAAAINKQEIIDAIEKSSLNVSGIYDMVV